MDALPPEKRRGWWFALLPTVILFLLLVLGTWYSCSRFTCDLFIEHRDEIASHASRLLPRIVTVILLFLLVHIFNKLVLELALEKTLSFARMPERFLGASKISKFLLWILFTLGALSLLTGGLQPILASLGLIGLGLTFALQKPIMNFTGWLTILVKGIYKEGDRIRVGSIKGDVREIQVMNTVLEGMLPNSETKSNKLITFPNEMVLTMEVENYTKDSNYVLDELGITITYESDYHQAIRLLESIVIEQIRRNKRFYIRQIIRKQEHVGQVLGSMMSKKRHSIREQKQMDTYRKEEEELKKSIEELETLEEEFKPKVRVELKDSSIELVAQFFTPYDMIKKTRTEINLAFMDAVKKVKNIEIAYPHLEIVPPKKPSPPPAQSRL